MASVRQILFAALSFSLPLFFSISVRGEVRKPAAPVQTSDSWKLPLVFEQNEGQLPDEVGFLGRTQHYTVAIGRKDLRFSLPGSHKASSVVLSLEGSGAAAPVGITQAPFLTNDYIGSNVAKYRTGIRNYSRIGLRHVYPGVDAEFYASGDEIEHDFIVAPRADVRSIAMRLRGGRDAKLTAAGEITVAAEEGELRLRKPVAYQVGPGGQRVEVAADFVLDAAKGTGQRLRFQIGGYDHSRTLVIDPVIVYATYVAGSAGSTASAITADATGNVYVTGYTTSPIDSFGVSSATTSLAGGTTAVFVARLAASDDGSKVSWLTYLGSDSGVSQSTSIALQASGGTSVYVGGTTTASDFPATAGTFQPTVTAAATHGFIASFAVADGSAIVATYVDSAPGGAANTSVKGLAVDSAGKVIAVGSAVGGTLPLSPDAIVVNATVLGSASLKGIVVKLDPTLTTEIFGTYLMGDMTFDTSLTGVAEDSNGNIYVGGYTAGDFPQAGVYSSTTMYTHNAADTTGDDSFAAQIVPTGTTTAATLGYSTWLSGSGQDQLNAIALDGSDNLLLFGQTASIDLITNTTYTYAGATPVTVPSPGQTATASPVTGTFPTKAGAATTSGFVARLDATGQPLVVTYVGGDGNDAVAGGAEDGSGLVYAVGSTSSTQPSFYAAATPTPTVLPAGQDTTTSGVQHGFLLQLPSALSAVNYVANVGGASGSDVAVGIALDSSANAYLAGNIGTGSLPYASLNAFQYASPSTTASSAYIAEIANSSTPAGLTLTVLTGSPTPDPIGYASSTVASTVTYTWVLNASSSSAPTNLVVQIPAQTALSYTSATMMDTVTKTAAAPCSITSAGVYCLIQSFPQTGGVNDTLNLVVGVTVQAAAPTSGTITVTATVSGPAPDLASATQTSMISPPSSLTITPASTFAAQTVFSTASGATSPNTQATYVFTVANAAGTGEAKKATFSLTAPLTGFQISSVTAVASSGGVATTCDLTASATGCSEVDLPGGASLTYTVIGTYLDSTVGVSGTSPVAGSFTASATGFLFTSPTLTISPNTTIERGVHLKVVGTLSAPPNSQTAFNLGDSLTYSINIANSGPSESSGADTLAVTLPAGFVATGVTGITCATPYTSCTIPAMAAGANITYGITGSFPDTSVNATVVAATQSKTFSAVATLVNSFESGVAGTDYSTTLNTTVQRTAVLSVATSSLTPPATICGGGPSCVYMLNTAGLKDTVPYNFVVKNAGPDTAVNATVTITLPFAPANPVGTPHPLNAGVPVTVATPPGFGSGLSCNYTAGTNQIVCTGGNLPVGNTPLTITGNATIDAGTIPATSESVTTASAAGSIAMTEDANGAPANANLPVVEVDRAAHLVTTKTVVLSGTTPASPINLDENKPSVAPGVNDTFTVTIQVGNTPLNSAPGVMLTETLPPYFRLTQPPLTSANCTVAGVPLTVNFMTQATPVVMTCALGTVSTGTATASSGGTAATVGTPFTSLTYAGKFQDNGINPDITGTLPAKLKQLTVNLSTATSATHLAVDPILPSDATSAAPSINVIRAAHLILRKTRNTSVAAAPSTFTDSTDPNLDEKTTATTFGVNDEVEYDIAVGNAGANTALGVQFTETLPPYFTVMKAYLVSGASTLPDSGANGVPGSQLPANDIACYAGGAASGTPIALPFPTGASSQQITCSYGTAANPLSLPVGPSRTGMPDNGTSIEFVYQGKYQDNAPNMDNIGAGVSTYAVPSNVGDASAGSLLAVDNGPASDGRSLALPTYSIQRAAHLTIFGSPLQLKPDESPLTPGGGAGTSIIAEAEPSSIGSATPVYNCLRYKVYIQNSGPNISRQPQLTLAPPTGLTLTESPTGFTTTPGTDAALPSSCAYGASVSPVITGAATTPLSERAGNTLVVDVDAYFGLNTLTSSNALTGFALSYAGLSDKGVMDSGKGSVFTPVTGNNVTVVNTPTGSNFVVSPFSTAGTRPAQLAFGTVAVPGITAESISSTGPGLPTGSSPDPRDNQKVIPLYRTGTSAPNFYSLSSTAVPAAGTNPTGICVASGTASPALSDGFAKPERVLLWALSGLPSGSTLNTVPNVTSPYAGDITTSVIPSSGTSYVEAGGPALPYTSYASLPAPQSQPGQVCGQVNGFAPAAAPVTLAVLEPVNFAPDIIANSQQVSQTPGKGVSEVSFLFPTSHDYNDSDPCYVASSASGPASRGTCDDNLVLTTWIFGGESLLPSLNHVVGPLTPSAAQAFTSASIPYEVQAGATLFYQVADQLAAPVYNAALDCDPGNAPGSYSPITTVPPCPINTSLLAGTPPQETVFGSASTALLTPSVNGGSSGLITLPPAADATSPMTVVQTGYVTASATITAGQTVGFQWKLLDIMPASGGTYKLSCSMVDSATQNTVTAFPAGLSCQIPATITYPMNPTTENSPSNPAIYVVTTGSLSARSTLPTWKTAAGGIFAALFLPLIVFRRRLAYTKKLGLLVLLLLLGGAVGLSGCGSGTGVAPVQVVAANTYYFRANATPINGGTTLTTAPFQVKVVSGD